MVGDFWCAINDIKAPAMQRILVRHQSRACSHLRAHVAQPCYFLLCIHFLRLFVYLFTVFIERPRPFTSKLHGG